VIQCQPFSQKLIDEERSRSYRIDVMQEKGLLIHSANQLLTIAGPPQRGGSLGELGMIESGAIYLEGDEIVEVGKTEILKEKYNNAEKIDASGFVVMPGFVDAHTHAIWAGDRAAEFEMRLQGKTYLEILQAGGGILSTVQATRAASVEQLKDETRPRLQAMFAHGATTIEAKTGYGLELHAELRMLQALVELDEEGPWELAITFLGAHAIPQEYKDDSAGYTRLIATEMLPQEKAWWHDNAGERGLPFVDVFCETGAFNLDESRQILEAARELGFPLKIHADEFDNLGGTKLGVELGAVSADHLVAASKADIAALAAGETAAVSLPGTPFGLGTGKYTPAKEILAAGGLLALASDLNPGTSWCENIQMALALACRSMGLTPAQAIAAATINGAAAVGRAERTGSLEAGKQADMLILDAPDYRHLGYRYGTNLVRTVIKKGTIYPVKGEG
jgi:imidazolonepropionase